MRVPFLREYFPKLEMIPAVCRSAACLLSLAPITFTHSLFHSKELQLTLDVEEDGLALDDVCVGGDAVAHAAAVVATRRLLHALQHEHAGVVDGGQHQAGARVRVPLLLQNFALKTRQDEK